MILIRGNELLSVHVYNFEWGSGYVTTRVSSVLTSSSIIDHQFSRHNGLFRICTSPHALTVSIRGHFLAPQLARYFWRAFYARLFWFLTDQLSRDVTPAASTPVLRPRPIPTGNYQ